jgi:hypothetical protein
LKRDTVADEQAAGRSARQPVVRQSNDGSSLIPESFQTCETSPEVQHEASLSPPPVLLASQAEVEDRRSDAGQQHHSVATNGHPHRLAIQILQLDDRQHEHDCDRRDGPHHAFGLEHGGYRRSALLAAMLGERQSDHQGQGQKDQEPAQPQHRDSGDLVRNQ